MSDWLRRYLGDRQVKIEIGDALRGYDEWLQSERALVVLPEQPPCPHCGSRDVTKIHRPEVYEFGSICNKCERGFG